MKAIRVGAVDWLYKVYVIGPGDGPLKIGLARDLQRRLYTLQTGNQQELHIFWSYKLLRKAEARAIERAAHQSLKDKRIRGEWFDCSIDEAIDAIWQHIDCQTYVARHMAVKDLRGFVSLEDCYKIAGKAQESITHGC
jgi:predicted GIY-YIG superfamily endonuclease